MERATIVSAKIYDVLDLWRKKPRQLAFNDTDAIVVTAKRGGKEIKETFFTCLKPDGTFSLKTPNTRSQFRRNKLAKFIKYYFKKDPEEYNLKEDIKDWKGKKVDLKEGFIYIP